MGLVASTTFRGHGPQSFIDRLRAIEAEACAGRVAAASDPSALDPCITQVLHLAEELLEEREQLLTFGEAQAERVFRRVAGDYRAQIREQAHGYSQAYAAIDTALAGWRAWMLGQLEAYPVPVTAPVMATPAWKPPVFA
jgi:hypothetical protein